MYYFMVRGPSEGARAVWNQINAVIPGSRITHRQYLRSDRPLPPALGGPQSVVINWGVGSELVERAEIQGQANIVNSGTHIRRVADKRAFFNHQVGCINLARLPEAFYSSAELRDFCPAGTKVVARRVLQGSAGEGIEIFEYQPGVDFPPASLYTKYVKKAEEYRVHYFNGEVILVQRKARRMAVAEPNWEVRTHDNGFNFVDSPREQTPQDVFRQAQLAFTNSELFFGAVDVIWNRAENRAYVLEINSAPGAIGRTVTAYGNAFATWINTNGYNTPNR